VSDTGPGIRRKCCRKFSSLTSPPKVRDRGPGLGLNIVQRLIKEGKGALHVHTQQDEGTTFTIYLPGANLAK